MYVCMYVCVCVCMYYAPVYVACGGANIAAGVRAEEATCHGDTYLRLFDKGKYQWVLRPFLLCVSTYVHVHIYIYHMYTYCCPLLFTEFICVRMQ
jgi:hypothetical protein